MFFNKSFILASSSSSRFKILKNNNLIFTVKKPNCDESFLKKTLIKKKISAKKISLELARLKSKSVSTIIKDKLVVGSDTVIELDGALLSKANNFKEAKKKLIKMSGKEHLLHSSASVFVNKKEVWKKTQTSKINIRKLTNTEIETYISKNKKNIFQAVGCYQVEKAGPNIIKNIKGDFFNVMGFPLFPFLAFLKEHNQAKEKK